MIKIAICDDESNILNNTKELIENYSQKEILIETYTNGEELLKSNTNFDIIFLDIDMEGINGIETAKKIREYDKQVKIIYITNYTDYTYSAFSVHAFGYLVKPLKPKELYHQLDEALSYIEEDNDQTLEFVTNEGVVRIDIKNIYYFEYQSRKVIMKTTDSKYLLKQKISEIASKMEPYGFAIPHKSFSVNLYNVKSIKGYEVYIMDGSIIPLSQKKSSEFRNSLNIYLSNHIEKSRRR